MKPFVSFIIPAYNSEKTIQKCLNSILGQNYGLENFEVLVVDNNSTDKTEEMTKKFSHVTLLKEPRQGRSFARNLGASIAKGKFFAFVDSDVFLNKEWLSLLVSDFFKETIGGGQGRIIPCNYDGQEKLNDFRIRQQNDDTKGTNIILDLMYAESPMINSAACIYRKEAFEFVGGFDCFLERHEDIDLSKRVSLAGFDLMSNSKAIAEVEYHAEGWFSYFTRSLEEGKTKEAYLQKWAFLSKLIKNSEVEMNNDLQVHQKNSKFLSSGKLIYYQVRDEIIFNLIKGLIFFESYYFLKAINSLFKSVGRLQGKLVIQYKNQPELKINQKLISRFVNVDGKKIPIENELRVVFKDREILYLPNIKTGEFFFVAHFKSIREIFKNSFYE